jgi:hypothetical protein
MAATKLKTPLQIDAALTFGVAKIRVDAADLTDSDTSQALTLNAMAIGRGESPVPANARIMYAWVNVITGFEGGTLSALTVTLGDAGAATELLTATDVFTGAEGVAPMDGAYAVGTFEAAYAPVATFAATGDDMDNIDTGALEICIAYEAINTDSLTS